MSMQRLSMVFFMALILGTGTSPLWAQASDESTATQTEAPPVPPAQPQAAEDDLRQAYQKEYAFLEAQRRDLQQRLNAFRQQAQQSVSQEESRINELEGAVISLESRSDRINNLLTEAERRIQSVEDNRQVLDATFQQADASVEEYGIEVLDGEQFTGLQDAAKIETLFNVGLDLVRRLGSIREEAGVFYQVDGTETEGRILRIGNVAAYGVGDQVSGPLAPAGENRLKLWPAAEQTDTARAIAAGRQPDSVDVFLFESTASAIEQQRDETVIETINSGGTIAWIIVGLGAVALILILLRVVFLQRASASTEKIVAAVGDDVRRGDREAALQKLKSHKGSTARVVGSAIRNLDRDREHLEDIVSEAILHESAHLNRFGSFILVIAAVSPLLGLLGTVTGMISTFDVITEFGTGDPKLLSGGISIALVTTEIGLAVAIPTLLFGNLLSGWATRIRDDMEKAALRVINIYEDRKRGSAAV